MNNTRRASDPSGADCAGTSPDAAGAFSHDAAAKLADELFRAIEHGDATHRAWLHEALHAFFAGKPVPPPRSDAADTRRPSAWQDIASAPKDGTEIQARIPGNGADNVIAWQPGLMDEAGQDCCAWTFTRDQEPPDCWTDGWCWDVNEDGLPSVQPTEWKPLAPPDAS